MCGDTSACQHLEVCMSLLTHSSVTASHGERQGRKQESKDEINLDIMHVNDIPCHTCLSAII